MTTAIEMKQTPVGKSYWNNEGAYEKENLELYKQLVPAMGEADTVNGELIRCINRLYHEYFNNGNMNARDEHVVEHPSWWYDEDDCEDDYEYSLNEYYGGMLKFISRKINTCDVIRLCDEVEEIILNNLDSDEASHTYDVLMDNVMYFVLTHENVKRAV